ncbi:hypothetical protein Cs7R123_52910 [Catellatospora sp. TT07R-123]|nr:hypothetical protein Cs7R123_52910 [Catellatospora sp. TT07R-123]
MAALVEAPGDGLAAMLPEGRLVYGGEGGDDQPALWVGDGPAPAGLWTALLAEHERSGLWPLLLDHLSADARRPWDDGELWPADMSDPADLDAGALLARWWTDHTEIDEDDNLPPRERLAVTAPYGQSWPGLSPALPQRHDPRRHAALCAAELLSARRHLRLGLAAADHPADAITAIGWQGAANYANDTAELSAVLRSWQDRFGAYVIGVGFAELYVSVAAPPATADEALGVAAEHFAFCPDNVWQGTATDLAEYARMLVDQPVWAFWWD